jgi:tetratricopeptide (TPR) repeat protein
MRLISSVYVIFALNMLFFYSAQAQKGFYSYQKGNKLYEQQKFKEAIYAFEQAIDSFSQINPKPVANLVKAHNNKGNSHGQLQNYLFALFDYNKAIELDKKLVESYMNRANVQTLLGNFSDAVADLNKALLLNPKLYEAFYQRGLIFLLDLEQFEAAERDLGVAADKMQTAPHEPMVYYALALYELKKYKAAMLVADKALAKKNDYPDAYYIRAMVYVAQKEYAKAKADINKALDLQPNTPEYTDLQKKIESAEKNAGKK